ncbi:MAG: FAD-dependent oxidoreductase [Clostridia bacterium]|nr:FAD-dependent oxidoreductase [Clostridia bacterium]
MKTLIVGGVAGGASCAARLRRLNEKAEIVILERGEFVSFANCGLPYYIGGEISDKSRLTLQTPQSFKARFNVDVRIFSEVVSVDTFNKVVTVHDLDNNQTYQESYDKLVLSPGAMPIKPPLEGVDLDNVFTLRNIPDTLKIKQYIKTNKPRSAVIVGGGYIGVEMAENLVKAGLEVTIVEMGDHLIAPLDFDMSADVARYIKANGVHLELGNGVKSIQKQPDTLRVTLTRGQIDTDMVLLSVGVRPDTKFLANSAIELDARGGIIVDEHMQTNVADVYAVGDAVVVKNFVTKSPASIALAGPANKQGRIVADNICKIPSTYNGTQGTSVLKLFDMTIATTGLNEKSAKDLGLDYDKTYTYSASHASYYPGASMLSVKVLWDKQTLAVLGAQIVGFEGVDKRMDVISTAMRLGAKVTHLAQLELCYAPPFGSAKDPVNMVGFVAENVTTGKVKQFFWHDVAHLPRDGSVTLLDTRTAFEVASGKIDGFVNIPLDALRANLDKIPKDKPVYVHCHSGLRSYIACMILAGHGYDCYNLAGGYRLYLSVMQEKAVPDYNCADCK